MKRVPWSTTIGSALASLLLFCVATVAQADDRGCSYRSVSGNWGFHVSGSYIDPNNPNYPNDSPAAGVGTFVLDRNGNITGAGSLGGGNSPFTFSGTYAVRIDCTGTLTIDVILNGQDIGGFNASLVFVDNSREVYWVSEQPDQVLSFVAKKLFGGD